MSLTTAASTLKIQWLANVVGFGCETMSLGFCQKNPDRIAFIAPDVGMAAFHPVIVRDLYLTDQGNCEEKRRCLVLNCPHNRTTYRYVDSARWKKCNLPKKTNFIRLLELLTDIEGWLKKDITTIDWAKDLTYAYREPTLILNVKRKENKLKNMK